MQNFLVWVVHRLREPTTWGGLTALLTGIGIVLSPEQTAAIVSVGVAVGGALMVFLPEASNKDE